MSIYRRIVDTHTELRSVNDTNAIDLAATSIRRAVRRVSQRLLISTSLSVLVRRQPGRPCSRGAAKGFDQRTARLPVPLTSGKPLSAYKIAHRRAWVNRPRRRRRSRLYDESASTRVCTALLCSCSTVRC